MTALVGVLNKRAAAIAADSAMTVTNNGVRKIYNNCQKIFPISEKNPVAVMFYSQVEFMGIPWDLIIKLYRQERGDKTFKELSDYCEDLLEFIGGSDFFTANDYQKDYFFLELTTVYANIHEKASMRTEEEMEKMKDPRSEEKASIFKKHLSECIKEFNKVPKNNDCIGEFKGYSFEKFMKYTKSFWEEFEKEYLKFSLDEDIMNQLQKAIYEYMISEVFLNATGLVFIGYGSKDIFPSEYSILISGIFDDRIRYLVYDEEHIISGEQRALILPFAQDDVMITMMKGIAPAMTDTISAQFDKSLEQLKDKIVEDAIKSGATDDTVARIRESASEHTKKVTDDFWSSIRTFIGNYYVDGILDAVDAFTEEDLANMAENLISITNLQRHISSSEETVGGPVEVAVLSKCGGFKWVKHRKWDRDE